MCFLCLKSRSNGDDVFFEKSIRPGKSCGVGVLTIFIAVMRYLFYFVCGVAVFRTPHVPLNKDCQFQCHKLKTKKPKTNRNPFSKFHTKTKNENKI